MNLTCRLLSLVAIVATGAACEKKPQGANSETDEAKLRPELAASRKTASPTPMLDEARVSPTATP